jgi:hypothetical protein
VASNSENAKKRLKWWPGWPDWVNFRLFGVCLHWFVFMKITKVPQIAGLPFSTVKVMYKICRKRVGLHFGLLFHKRIWSPWWWQWIFCVLHLTP